MDPKVISRDRNGLNLTITHDKWTISLPPELHPFILLVLDEPAHQQRLAVIIESSAFVAEAQQLASEHGILLDPAMLDHVLKPDPLGIGRFAAAPIECSRWPPPGWLPTRSVPTGAAPAFDWLWFGTQSMTRSFYEDEVRGANALPFNWLFRIRTRMDAVIGGAAGEAHVPLKGLIFHMSRCGSTLLSQMFAALPDVAVTSEPEPVDAVFRWIQTGQVEPAAAMEALRSIMAAMGRVRRTGVESHIVKLDAWHVFALPLFRDTFPDSNWVYLFRNSVEVMVSMGMVPGIHIIPDHIARILSGIDFDTAKSHDDYTAQVLASIGKAVLTHWDVGGGMLVEYIELVEAAPASIADHFGLRLNASARAQMTGAALHDSKAPDQRFSSDTAHKQAAASGRILAAVAEWMDPVEQNLRQLKLRAAE